MERACFDYLLMQTIASWHCMEIASVFLANNSERYSIFQLGRETEPRVSCHFARYVLHSGTVSLPVVLKKL